MRSIHVHVIMLSQRYCWLHFPSTKYELLCLSLRPNLHHFLFLSLSFSLTLSLSCSLSRTLPENYSSERVFSRDCNATQRYCALFLCSFFIKFELSYTRSTCSSHTESLGRCLSSWRNTIYLVKGQTDPKRLTVTIYLTLYHTSYTLFVNRHIVVTLSLIWHVRPVKLIILITL